MLLLNVDDLKLLVLVTPPTYVALTVSCTSISHAAPESLEYAIRDPSSDILIEEIYEDVGVSDLTKVHTFPETVYTLYLELSYTTRT